MEGLPMDKGIKKGRTQEGCWLPPPHRRSGGISTKRPVSKGNRWPKRWRGFGGTIA